MLSYYIAPLFVRLPHRGGMSFTVFPIEAKTCSNSVSRRERGRVEHKGKTFACGSADSYITITMEYEIEIN